MKPGKELRGASRKGAPEAPSDVVFLEFDDWRAKALEDPGSVKDYGVILGAPPAAAKQTTPGDDYNFDYVISSEEQDRDNDVIHVAGWTWDNYFRGGDGPVLTFHDRKSLPVAKCDSIKAIGMALVAHAQFPTPAEAGFEPGQPFHSNTVRCLTLNGYIKNASVGFLPDEWTYNEELGGFEFMAQEGLEWSIVPVPANPGCFQLAASKGIDLAPLHEAMVRSLDEIHGRPGAYVTRSKLELVLRACGLGVNLKTFDLSEARLRAALKAVRPAPDKGKAAWGPTAAEAPVAEREPGSLAAELAQHGVSLAALVGLVKGLEAKDADPAQSNPAPPPAAAAPPATEAPAAPAPAAVPTAGAPDGEVVLELADDPSEEAAIELDGDIATFKSELKETLRAGVVAGLNAQTPVTGQVW